MVKKEEEVSRLQPKQKSLTRHQLCWHLDLGLPAGVQKCEFNTLSLQYIVTAAQAKADGNRRLLVNTKDYGTAHIIVTVDMSKARGVPSRDLCP